RGSFCLARRSRGGGGRAADGRSVPAAARVGRLGPRGAFVGRLAPLGAGPPPLGAPPWRFWARGRASLTGLASGSVTASSSHPGPSARRAGSGASRDERLPAARRGTPLLAPSSRRWL